MVSDADLLTLCAYEEARNQVDDGVAAIARVVENRVRQGYQCDHSIAGAITRHAQFSWTEYAMSAAGYHEVAFGTAEELARIQQLLAVARADRDQWERCARITASVMTGRYSTVAFARLTADTVLYYNPDACAAPPWAKAGAFVCRIGSHQFYRDLAWSAMHGAPTKTAAAPAVIAASSSAIHTVEVDV